MFLRGMTSSFSLKFSKYSNTISCYFTKFLSVFITTQKLVLPLLSISSLALLSIGFVCAVMWVCMLLSVRAAGMLLMLIIRITKCKVTVQCYYVSSLSPMPSFYKKFNTIITWFYYGSFWPPITRTEKEKIKVFNSMFFVTLDFIFLACWSSIILRELRKEAQYHSVFRR